jgi:hypothetical protein
LTSAQSALPKQKQEHYSTSRNFCEVNNRDFIDPVPLEGPEYAPPPRELAAKHFNDPLLAFMAAAGMGTHQT